jgi:hypothetical protein
MSESTSMWIPPVGSSGGSWKLLIVTPGRPLKAFKVTSLLSETPSKIVPRAVTRSLLVWIVQVKLGLCKMNVANVVNLRKKYCQCYLPRNVYWNSLPLIGNREAGIRVIVRDTNIGGSTD